MTKIKYFVFVIFLGIVVAAIAGSLFFMRSNSDDIGEIENHYLIVFSTSYGENQREIVYRKTIDFLGRDMPVGSSFEIFDGVSLSSITSGEVPNLRAYSAPSDDILKHSKSRLDLLAEQRDAVNSFLKNPPDESGRAQKERLSLGSLFIELGRYYKETGIDKNVYIIVLGSPLYHDDNMIEYSFLDGFFPSDGHLFVRQQASIFGLRGLENLLDDVRVYWGWASSPGWFDRTHEVKVTEFWDKYITMLGGESVVIDSGVEKAFDQAALGTSRVVPEVAVDEDDRKVEMRSIRRRSIDNLVMELLFWNSDQVKRKYDQFTPLRSYGGDVKIGISWECQACDVDLYVSDPSKSSETELFWGRRRTGAGQFYKDFAMVDAVPAPINGYEYVELNNVHDVRSVLASVNFYEGEQEGGVKGILRVEFEERIFDYKFDIDAENGNGGIDKNSNRYQSQYWDVYKLGDLLPH